MSTDNKRTFTTTEYNTALVALASLWSIVGGSEMGEGALPPFKDCNDKQVEAVLVRTAKHLVAYREAQEHNILKEAKEGVDLVCGEARSVAIAAYAKLHATFARSPELAKMYGAKLQEARPTYTGVPVSDVIGYFPSGSTMEQVVSLLHRMSYKMVKGAQKNGEVRISVGIGEDALKKACEEAVSAEG